MNFNRLRYSAPGVYQRILNSIDDTDRDFDTNEREDKYRYCMNMPEVDEDGRRY